MRIRIRAGTRVRRFLGAVLAVGALQMAALPPAVMAAPADAPVQAELASTLAQQQGTGLTTVGPLVKGTVVALRGTPHLWFADEKGVLHWGGDTRALQGKDIRWDLRKEVSLDQLKSLPKGDPWLSAGLLKMGDPIYFVKWETEWAQPQLLHIQSIRDVELFGIDSNNYGTFVMEQAAWEQRFNMRAANLQRGTLASANTGGPSTADAWRQVSPGGFGASVYIPNVVTTLAEGQPIGASATLGITGGREWAYAYERADRAVVLLDFGYVDTEPGRLAGSTATEILAAVVYSLASSSDANQRPSLTGGREVTLGSYSGLETKVERPSSSGTVVHYQRLYIVGDRLYFQQAVMLSSAMALDETVRFLDSFAVRS